MENNKCPYVRQTCDMCKFFNRRNCKCLYNNEISYTDNVKRRKPYRENINGKTSKDVQK